MRRTTARKTDAPITVNSTELQARLGVGRFTAEKIAKAAKAEIKIGKRRLYNVKKITEYIDYLSMEGDVS